MCFHHAKTQIPILFLASLSALMILFSGCSDGLVFQKTNDPSIDIRSDDNCKVYLVGQVIDARTLEALEGASVRLADESTSSDSEGMYRIEVKDPLDQIEQIRTMSVRMKGYEIDTYQFKPSDWVEAESCEGAISYICLDYVMTPMHEPVVIQPNADANIQFRDTSIYLTDQFGEGLDYDTLISVLNLFIPAGSVDVPTPLWLTSYARSSYAGSVAPGSSMNLPLVRFRISTNPMIDLKKPFVLSFTSNHPVPFAPSDQLDLYRYNSLIAPYKYYDLNTNVWKDVPDALVGYDQQSGTIQVRSKILGSYLVTNEEYSITLNKQVTLGDEISVGSLSNCDCGDAKYIKHEVTIDGKFQYGLQSSNMFPLFDRMIYMNDWKVMTNEPSSTLVTLQNGPGMNQYNQFIPGPSKSFEDFALLQKCEQLFFSYRSIDQQAGGSEYGTQYGFQRSIGVQYSTSSFLCPTSSACHQGCPK